MTDRAIPERPTLHRLALQSLAAFALGTMLTILVVLPAEYGVDVTGFGALTGLTEISAPREVVVQTRTSAPPEIARAEVLPFRQDSVIVPVSALGSGRGGAIEYKVTMEQGQTLLYSWTASHPVLFEFHGHTAPTDGQPIEVMDYMKGHSGTGNGTLVAPVDGIHGWYFANPGFEAISVTLTLSGYYRLEPGLIEVR